MDRYDIIVVGAGPAGMTAALNCLRAGKSVLVLEGDSFGGQISAQSGKLPVLSKNFGGGIDGQTL